MSLSVMSSTVHLMDSHRVASSGSSSCARLLIMVLKVMSSSSVAARVAKRITFSVASFSLSVCSLEALVRSDRLKGSSW